MKEKQPLGCAAPNCICWQGTEQVPVCKAFKLVMVNKPCKYVKAALVKRYQNGWCSRYGSGWVSPRGFCPKETLDEILKQYPEVYAW